MTCSGWYAREHTPISDDVIPAGNMRCDQCHGSGSIRGRYTGCFGHGDPEGDYCDCPNCMGSGYFPNSVAFSRRECDARLEMIDGVSVSYIWYDRLYYDARGQLVNRFPGPCVFNVQGFGTSQRATYEEAREAAERRIKQMKENV